MKRFLAALLVSIVSPALAATMPVEEYVSSLERISSLLAANEIELARSEARALSAHDVSSPLGSFQADLSLLDAIANSDHAGPHLRSRLAVTIEEIRNAAPIDPAPVRPDLLRRVAAEQKVPELVPGGEILPAARPSSMMDRVVESLGAMYNWLSDKIRRIIDWLLDLLPRRLTGPDAATPGMRWMIGALVVTIVLLIVYLAIEVTRRARRGRDPLIEESTPLGSKRDEDPLSRGALEWDRYAEQLAAEGRFREAVRASYHAVLVTCYAAGVLHFRKGRTNWEYVSALAPSLPWRAEFITLTRRFEREWYGSDNSTSDAYDDCRRQARSIVESVRRAARGAA
ncbi:MAG TPA: DUF4129 domain-containing protein [Thermoanaerobaculia bacterium]|nr:DUF4129 domain-containing protein [Thermoanaerobaculia bacterium]